MGFSVIVWLTFMCFYENSNLGRCLLSLGMLHTFSNKKSDSSIRKCYFPFVLGKLDRLVFFGGGGRNNEKIFLWLQTTTCQNFNFNGNLLSTRGKCTAAVINENAELIFTIFVYGYMSKIMAREFVCSRIRSFVFHSYTRELFIHYVYCVLLKIYVAIFIITSLRTFLGPLIHFCELEV